MQQAVAEPEAQEVSTTEPARDSKKADGQCNEIGEPMIGPELGVQPGDQGSATDDAETVADEADKYVPPEPTPDEVKTAEEVFTELQQQGPRQIGAERTIVVRHVSGKTQRVVFLARDKIWDWHLIPYRKNIEPSVFRPLIVYFPQIPAV